MNYDIFECWIEVKLVSDRSDSCKKKKIKLLFHEDS